MTSSPKQFLPDLFALQQLDTKIQQIKRSQSHLDNGKFSEEVAITARSEHKGSSAQYHATHASLRDNELKLSTLEAKLANIRKKMYEGSVTNAKELTNIEKEIASLERQRADLDDVILTLMEKSESEKTLEVDAEGRAAAAEAKHQTVLADFSAKLSQCKTQLTQLATHRNLAIEAIPDAKLLKRYEDLRVRYGGLALVPISEGRCDGCKMPLSGTIIKAAETDDDISYCDNCGRMLVALSQLRDKRD